jgi:hypothetical protein
MEAMRNLIQFCLLGILLLGLPIVSQAQLTFITNNAAITITGYTGNPTVLVIPSTTNGYPVTGIGVAAFTNVTLKSLTIPDSVISMGSTMCYRCTGLTNVVLGSSLTNISKQAFSGCTNLSSVSISNSVIAIETNAFTGCSSLAGITIPNNVTSIGSGAFYRCTSLTNVTIGTNVTTIGSLAFACCTNLTGLVIPDSVTNLSRSAFDSCSSLAQVSMGNGVIGIGDSVFWSCTGITNIMIPNQVNSIGNDVFWFCTNLSNIAIGDGLTNIGTNVFNWCLGLNGITVDPANSYYSSEGGVLFDKSQTTLIQYPIGEGSSYNVPDGITNIGQSAFSDCNVTVVTLPDSITMISSSAFDDCDGLTSLYFRGNAPSVDSTAFYYVSNAIVYYLPGTTGWVATYGGFPTTLWLPQAQASGVATNQFGFNINWASGQTVVVEACTNLSSTDWQPVQTNVLSSDSAYFSDPQWANYPGRFYRLRSP